MNEMKVFEYYFLENVKLWWLSKQILRATCETKIYAGSPYPQAKDILTKLEQKSRKDYYYALRVLIHKPKK